MSKIDEKIRKVAEDFAKQECEIGDIDFDALYKGFCNGAKWALSHQWVSVDDKLPELDKEVLFVCEYGFFTGFFNFMSMWFANGIGEVSTVTHWMPLPPLPEARKEEE